MMFLTHKSTPMVKMPSAILGFRRFFPDDVIHVIPMAESLKLEMPRQKPELMYVLQRCATYDLRAVLVSLTGSVGAHVVTIFPCVEGGATKWTACNTWGRNGSCMDIDSIFRDLGARGFTTVVGFTLVYVR